MLLTLTTTHAPATDLGYLLHKRPDRFQSFALSFGTAHAYYAEATPERCTACLLLDVDAVGLVRRQTDRDAQLAQYVNDRPFAASSFLSVAIAQVYGSALQGRCKDRPGLAAAAIPLVATLDALPVRGGESFLRSVFEPLGYEVEAARHALDEQFTEWGDSPYFTVTIRQTLPLSQLLSHLYVLIPVFDARKHYFIASDEVDKLLAKGDGWLAGHPVRDAIARRYLGSRQSLTRQALARLVPEAEQAEDKPTKPPRLHDERHAAVLAELRASGARRVLDLGCGDGMLLRELLKDKQFGEVAGMDVSVRSLEIASRRLKLDRSPQERLKLLHGSLTYRDARLAGYDAAAVVEVVEHLDPPRLAAFERVLFEFARPRTVVLTTPNRDYNAVWESLSAGEFRHADHRFEWSRGEFHDWATGVAARFGYGVRIAGVGPEAEGLGSPSQLAVFTA